MTIPWAIVATLALTGAQSTAPDDTPDTIVMRGERMHVWPVENLIQRGFDLKRIPRSENAAWLYLEAINAFEDVPDELESAFDRAVEGAWPVDGEALERFLDQPGNAAAIEALHKAAAMRQCQLPYFGDETQSIIAVLLPNLSHMRFLAKLAVVDGRRSESKGRYDVAADNYITLMGMAGHVSQGTTLIEGLVGVAIWQLGNKSLRDMILQAPLTAGELRKLARRLDRASGKMPTVRRGLASERVFGTSMVDELCARPLQILVAARMSEPTLDGVGLFSIDGEVNPVPDDGWGRLELRIGQLILPDRAIKKHMLGYYDAVLDEAGRTPAGNMAFDEERYVNEEVPHWDVISRVMLPSLSRSVALGHRAEAERGLTRLAVALRAHMADHEGQPPGTLAELEPPLPDSAVRDPFTGDPLMYRIEDDGWVVYSAGLNLADDGGVAGARWDEADIVCRYPPAPIETPQKGANR